jgi:hypothetical protein
LYNYIEQFTHNIQSIIIASEIINPYSIDLEEHHEPIN